MNYHIMKPFAMVWWLAFIWRNLRANWWGFHILSLPHQYFKSNLVNSANRLVSIRRKTPSTFMFHHFQILNERFLPSNFFHQGYKDSRNLSFNAEKAGVW